MARKNVFREVSLDRLSSPEQLDQLMQVTSPTGWFALASLCGLVIAAAAWAVFGEIPTTAVGEGILLRSGGVTTVVSTGSGQVDEILFTVGDVVERGQVVATIRQDGIERQIADNRARRESELRELDVLERYAREQAGLSRASESQKKANLRRSIETSKRQIQLLERNLEAQRELLADGLVTQQSVIAEEQKLNQERDRLASYQLELSNLDLTRLDTQQALDQQLEVQRSQIRDLELALRELEASLEENVQVVAPETGRVLELMVDSGSVVGPGSQVLSMEIVSDQLIAVLFVPADLGKQVVPGMEARVTPTTVKQEEHGFMQGAVSWVAEFPSSSRGMSRLLANDDLVSRLMALGQPIQVDIELYRNAETPTGFEWSSSSGPRIEITSGTLITGSVIVERKRPIALVVPKLRETFGV